MAVETFIAGHPEFTIEETPVYEGLSSGVREWGNGSAAGIENTVRIWPHRTRGEGHFIAVLRKDGADREHKRNYPSYFRDRKALKDYYDFCNQYLTEPNEWIEQETFILFGEQLYRIPGEMPGIDRLRIVRPGLHLGSFKKNRFEPSHALALALRKGDAAGYRDYPAVSREADAYLRGETITDTAGGDGRKGWTLMTVDGYSCGWAKLAGGVLKNHYPKGLRK